MTEFDYLYEKHLQSDNEEPSREELMKRLDEIFSDPDNLKALNEGMAEERKRINQEL